MRNFLSIMTLMKERALVLSRAPQLRPCSRGPEGRESLPWSFACWHLPRSILLPSLWCTVWYVTSMTQTQINRALPPVQCLPCHFSAPARRPDSSAADTKDLPLRSDMCSRPSACPCVLQHWTQLPYNERYCVAGPGRSFSHMKLD